MASRVRTPSRTRVYLLCRHLLCSCLAWHFRVSFQALFGDAQCLFVQLGFLGHVPYLGDYYGQNTSNVIAVGMACCPKMPTPASTLVPFATGSILIPGRSSDL